MAVAGRKSIAMIDLDHAAIAAVQAGGDHLAVGGRAHRIAGSAADIDAGMDRGAFDERIPCACRTASSCRCRRTRVCARAKAASVRLSLVDMRARKADAVELAFEWPCIGGEFDRDKRAAHARARRCGFQLRDIEAEVGEHATHAADRANSILSSTELSAVICRRST